MYVLSYQNQLMFNNRIIAAVRVLPVAHSVCVCVYVCMYIVCVCVYNLTTHTRTFTCSNVYMFDACFLFHRPVVQCISYTRTLYNVVNKDVF